ncbi:glutaminase A L-glutamine amidohydrolase [Piedraia hortae CBS 480.64]|uniref:Glutaminase A L-glutamine amidohydrolase n=1 Tax=Piedraia hortae CBS 480.64 TaxID=1314780 RepID=A0A6A7BZE2_9PEZI|nr:glutaminase A L-glutamine amidohydrolase [Piedraia hortae CBS 480.64]
MHLPIALVAFTFSLVHASSLTPPILPLIVRGPYLSTWLDNARDVPWSRWPMFYNRESIGFSVLASVPHTSNVYPLLGRAHDSLDLNSSAYNVTFPRYQGAQYDPSTTNLTYSLDNDNIHLTLSFLSPITPTSTLRQAIPASYIQVHVCGSSNVNVYIDANGEWAAGDRGAEIEWELNTAKGTKTWSVKRKNELLFTENNDRAEWGTFHFTGPEEAHFEAGTSAGIRHRFAKGGRVNDTIDNRFRSVMDDEPVFAFSRFFNLTQKAEQSALFTLALVQSPVVQFASARGLTAMRSLWQSYFSSSAELIQYHYHDYPSALALSSNYTAQVFKDSERHGGNHTDILSLSARQAMGALSFSGTPQNPLIFLKEISSNGNAQTVDIIFPASPFFFYTNPRWLVYLLEPIIEHTLSGQYPNDYAMHDLGTHFPNLTGHADGKDEYMPVEESGNLLIIALALVNNLMKRESPWSTAPSGPLNLFPLSADKRLDGKNSLWVGPTSPFSLMADVNGIDLPSRDPGRQSKKWLTRTYPLLKQWTSYLVEYALEPHNQLSTDDFAGWLALQTNLALKGIIGIKAMATLSALNSQPADEKYYQNISESYIAHWQNRAISRDGKRAKLAYDWYGSWTTLYSLYADSLLCFHPHHKSREADIPLHNQQSPQLPLNPVHRESANFIPEDLYTAQSTWYKSVIQKFGLPLDSRHLLSKSDWQFEAAAVASPETRSIIFDRIAKWVNETVTDKPLSDLFVTEGGGGFPGPDFFARPVVGGHFAVVVLDRVCK